MTWGLVSIFVLFTAAMVVLVAAGIRQTGEFEKSLNAQWKRVSKRAGLRYRQTREGRRAQGVVDGRKLRLYTESQQAGNAAVIFTRAATSSRSIPRSLVLRAEGPSLRRVFQGDDEQTGDIEFDDVARIDGHPADVAALMDSRLRQLLKGRLSRGLLTVRKGRVVVSSDPGQAREPDLAALIRVCGRIAGALELDPEDRLPRLLRNAAEDPDADVRLNCLRMAAEHHAEASELLPALQAGLADPEPAVRLFAATELGDESRAEHARDVARWLAEGGDIDELVETLAVVGEEGGREDVEWLRPLTRGAFRKRAVKQAAADAVARIQERLGGQQGGLALSEESDGLGRLSEPTASPSAGSLSPSDDEAEAPDQPRRLEAVRR